MTKTITFKGIEFDTASEAIQHYYASGYGDRVISLDRKHYVVEETESDRLAIAGVSFAYVFCHERPDGRDVLMSVPVN